MHRPWTVIALCVWTTAGEAQERQPQSRDDPLWVGAAIALTNAFTVADGATGSRWQFSSSAPVRVSIEKRMTTLANVGIAAQSGSVPLTYSACACDADGTVRRGLLFVNAGTSGRGGGSSFFSAFELGIGATGYSDFRARSDNRALGPEKTDWDLTLSIGYGGGLAITERLDALLGVDFLTTIHQQAGLRASESGPTRIYSTRIGVRYRL